MYSMFQSGIDSPLFNMSRVVSTKPEQRFPNMVAPKGKDFVVLDTVEMYLIEKWEFS